MNYGVLSSINYLYFSTLDGIFQQYRLPKESYSKRIKFSDDTKNIFFSSKDNQVLVTNNKDYNSVILGTQKHNHHFNLVGGHTYKILCGAFSEKSEFIITGGEDNIAIVWRRDYPKHILKGHSSTITQVFLSNDAKKAFTVSFWDNTARIWNLDLKDLYLDTNTQIRFNSKTNTYEYQFNGNWINTNIKPESIINQSGI